MGHASKEARSACSAAYYQRHKERIKAQVLDRKRAQRMVLREYAQEVKESAPCPDCGGRYPHYVMDFHHLRDKVANIADMVNSGDVSLDTLKNEIAKCVVLCSNCHRVRTWVERGVAATEYD